jgi:hypothetical protein
MLRSARLRYLGFALLLLTLVVVQGDRVDALCLSIEFEPNSCVRCDQVCQITSSSDHCWCRDLMTGCGSWEACVYVQ